MKIAISLSVTLQLAVSLPLFTQGTLSYSHLPIVVLQTNGQAVPDEPKITARMGIVYHTDGSLNHPNDPFNVYDGFIGIEKRGSSSFYYEKTPYTIELRNEEGEDEDASILGMPAESDFALISPLNDKTLIRDVMAHHLGRQALPWSPRTRMVEVVLNGEYIGVYTLIETIKRGADRVAVSKLKEDDTQGVDVTGGYIFRIDKFGPPPGEVGGHWMSPYPPVPNSWQSTWYQHVYPKVDEIQPQQQIWIRQHIHQFETAMLAPNASDHVAEWIDVDAWVNYALVEELGKNTDGYRLSAYLYKDRSDAPGGGKIAAGPLWDFNIAFGIGDYCGGSDWTGWAKDFNLVCGDDSWVIPYWWETIWNSPVFQQRLSQRWHTLREGVWSNAALIHTVDSLKNVIGPAASRNFNRWPVLGTYVWPNAYIGFTWEQEMNYFKNWLLARAAWMDANIPAQTTQLNDTAFAQNNFWVYPNPVEDRLYIKTNARAASEQFHLALFDAKGKMVLEQRWMSANGVTWTDLPPNLPAGAYWCRFTSPYGDLIRSVTLLKR